MAKLIASAVEQQRTESPRVITAVGVCATQPFRTAEEAWFWTMATLRSRRRLPTRSRPAASATRQVTPEEILRCLDRLYRQRRIDLVHARVLKHWGQRGRAPDSARDWEGCDARIWREAIERLEWPLRVRGIVREARSG